MQETWGGTLEPILYSMMFTRKADAAKADWSAQKIVDEQPLGRSVAESYADLVAAQASAATLTDAPWDLKVTEEQFRIHLGMVIQALEKRRPWPPVPYRLLPASGWFEFESPRPIAHVRDFRMDELGDIFNIYPDNLPDNLLSYVFQLSTGETLALIGSQLSTAGSTLYQRDREDPKETLTHFLALTKFTESDITSIPISS